MQRDGLQAAERNYRLNATLTHSMGPTPPEEPCRVCARPSRFIQSQTILGYNVNYFDCPHCAYIQTEYPHWLAQAHENPINHSDTGIMMRNLENARKVAMTLLSLGKLHGTVVDHAGGYGILVRLLRDAGIDAFWSDKYCENILARGFETNGGPCDLATAFEVFEHLVDPLAELRKMLADASAVLLSTELVATAAPMNPDWWYLGRDHGQHIGFFRTTTFEYMARTLGCHYRTTGRSTHLFSTRPVPTVWPFLVGQSRWSRVVTRLTLRSKTSSDSAQIIAGNRPDESTKSARVR